MELDLSDLKSVEKFCAEYQASGRPLDVLILNAGAFFPSPRRLTKDTSIPNSDWFVFRSRGMSFKLVH